MKTLFVIAVVTLFGCASTPKQEGPTFDEMCKSWVGQPASDLIVKMGIPNKEYKVDDSTKLIQYSYADNSRTVGIPLMGQMHYKTVSYNCDLTFTVKDGVVSKYDYQGNHCK